MNVKFRVPVSCLVLAILLAAITGCSGGSSATTPVSGTTTASTEAGYQIKVTYKGQAAAPLTLARLQTLPQVELNAGDKSEAGPTLLSALELDGIKDFTSITVSGLVRGRVASAELTLKRSEVTSDVLLDFTNRGTCKLAGNSIPQDKWIIDVSEIKVE